MEMWRQVVACAPEAEVVGGAVGRVLAARSTPVPVTVGLQPDVTDITSHE